MDGMKWYHAPLLLFAAALARWRRRPAVTRAEVEAMVEAWGADWRRASPAEAVQDIVWMMKRSGGKATS